jgi:RNA polymerase sigma factor (sigma-70 family)
MDELSLIRLAQEGDTLAFRSLFEENKQQVFSIAFHYLKNAEDAEDVLQETFIKAYHALHKYSPEKGVNFGCWLNRICVNASIDALRRNKVRESAVFWLGQKASAESIKALKDIVDEPKEESGLKDQAVFAISQLPKEKSVTMLIDIAKTNKSPSVRKKAIFWLGQTGDESALKFFEEILLKK